MSINQTQARAQSPSPSTNPSTSVHRGSSSNSSSTTNLGGPTTSTRVNAGPKHHTYPKTTPPRNPKYNPIPPDVTPESTLSQSNSQHSKSSAGKSDATHVHREDTSVNRSDNTEHNDTNMDVDKDEPINPLAILNAVAPPSLSLPPTLSLASTTSSNAHSHWYWKPQQSMSSSKHGSPIVSPSPSSFPPSEVSISCEEIPLEMALALSPPGTPGASYSISQERNVVAFVRECDSEKEDEKQQKSTTKSEDLLEGAGEYIQKSIVFGGGQALPFAIEEEEELESGDGTESSSFYTTTSASASASASAPTMQKTERTKSSHSAGAGSKKSRRAGSFKGRSIRKRIRRIFGGSKGGFKGVDRVQI